MIQRKAIRVRSLLGATIIHSDGAMKIDCKVRDISTSGARLSLSPHILLPQRFDLFISQRRETHVCRLVWFRDGQCGVEFQVEEPKQGPTVTPGLDLMARLMQLEAENATLRAEVERLRRLFQTERPMEARFA